MLGNSNNQRIHLAEGLPLISPGPLQGLPGLLGQLFYPFYRVHNVLLLGLIWVMVPGWCPSTGHGPWFCRGTGVIALEISQS